MDTRDTDLKVTSFSPEGAGVPVNVHFRGADLDARLTRVVADKYNPDNPQTIEKLRISSAWLIDSGMPGPRVTIFGGVHGFETCGVRAVIRLLRHFASASKTLVKGSLVLALGNEEAIREVARQNELNLNRLCVDETDQNDARYEPRRAHELMSLIRPSQYFLDLHSTSATSSEPFGLVPLDHLDFAKALGLGRILITPEAWRSGVFKGTASEYAIGKGIKGITVECGQHKQPSSAIEAYNVSKRLLIHAGILTGEIEPATAPLVIEPFHIQRKERDDFVFKRDPMFENFEFLHKGDLIGQDGVKEFKAEEDCYIVFPTPPQQSKIGVEVYLLARRVLERAPTK